MGDNRLDSADGDTGHPTIIVREPFAGATKAIAYNQLMNGIKVHQKCQTLANDTWKMAENSCSNKADRKTSVYADLSIMATPLR